MKIRRAAIALGFILCSIAGLSGCGRNRELVEMTERTESIKGQELTALPRPESKLWSSNEGDSADSESEETTSLTALAEDMEEAEKIADLYGIELESFSYGVATYTTDKDVQELMNLGEENDYPTLAPNNLNKLYREQ